MCNKVIHAQIQLPDVCTPGDPLDARIARVPQRSLTAVAECCKAD